MSKIYKILTHSEWEAANKLGYVKTDLDDKDGFIHCSTAKQLALTLHFYFKKEKSLVLCEIEDRNLNRSEYLLEKALSNNRSCLLYTSPSPRDLSTSRMPSSA